MALYFRQISETPLQDLPSHDKGEDYKWCDVCKKKGKGKITAAIYCTQCDKRFCTRHEEVCTVD